MTLKKIYGRDQWWVAVALFTAGLSVLSCPAAGAATTTVKKDADAKKTSTANTKKTSDDDFYTNLNFYKQPASEEDFSFENFTRDDLLPKEPPKVEPVIDTRTAQTTKQKSGKTASSKGSSALGTWLWPNGGATATTVNTDYRTRPANAKLPVFVKGKGFGKIGNLPYGKEDPYRGRLTNYMPTDLVLIPLQYCYYRQPTWLRREAAEHFVRMSQAAAKDGVKVLVFSGYRDANHQRRLKSGGGRVGNPGRSEHHLGTTIDVTDNEKHVTSNSYGSCASGRWMKKNAGKYGFVNSVRGEPWHYRYVGTK